MSRSSRVWMSWAATVLLVLAVHSLGWAVEEKPWFKKEHFKCPVPGMEMASWGGSQHYLTKRHPVLGPDTVWSIVQGWWENKRADRTKEHTRTAGLEIRFYKKPGDARKIFNYHLDHGPRRGLAQADQTPGLRRIRGLDDEGRFEFLRFDARNKMHWGDRILLRGRYFIKIHARGTTIGSDERLAAIADVLERCALAAIPKAGGTLEGDDIVLRLEYVHPFAPKIPPGRGTGDVIATVTDGKGLPVPGGEVVFFCKPGSPLAKVLEPSHVEMASRNTSLVRHDTTYIPALDWAKTIAAIPDENGRAVSKALLVDYLRYWDLAQAVAASGKFRGELQAVLLHIPHAAAERSKVPTRVIARASLPVEFTCIARISRIASLDPDHEPKVRVQSNRPGATGTRAVTLDKLPAELHVGDTLLLDQDDFVDVEWISGAKMEVRVKNGFLEEGQFAKFHIGHKDAGWYRKFDEWWGGAWAVVEVGTPGVVIGYFHTPAGLVHGVGTITFAVFYSIGQGWKDPLIVTPHSQLLFDFDKQVTVYTLEGRADLRHPQTGAITAVAAGNKTTFSPQGQIAAPSAFQRPDLSGALAAMADSLETKAQTARTAAASGEGTYSSSRDRGGSAGIIVLLVILAVMIVAAVVAFLILRKRRAA